MAGSSAVAVVDACLGREGAAATTARRGRVDRHRARHVTAVDRRRRIRRRPVPPPRCTAPSSRDAADCLDLGAFYRGAQPVCRRRRRPRIVRGPELLADRLRSHQRRGAVRTRRRCPAGHSDPGNRGIFAPRRPRPHAGTRQSDRASLGTDRRPLGSSGTNAPPRRQRSARNASPARDRCRA